MSIGLGVLIVVMEAMYLKTQNKMYERMTKFWVKIFALTFAMGVSTGIVMEFEFGTNWATYSRFVGDVFGSALAAEGIFAFFLESGFLAILVFGWDKVSPKVHFFSTIMVALGAHLSAVWIVVANSWQQTPAGFHVVGEGIFARAEITDFWAMVFNPSSVERLLHTLSGAWLTGAFLVISVSAFYIIKNRHIDSSKATMKIGLILALFASLFQLFTGHLSADGVAENHPSKLAAFEGHYQTGPADMYLFGWVDEENEKVHGIKIPGMLSMLVHFDSQKPVTGLDSFAEEDRPPVNIVFQTYHIMIAIGMFFILFAFFGIYLWSRGKLFDHKWFLKLAVIAVILPQIGNQVGWYTAEIGRQPWIVWGLLRTSDGISKAVEANQIWFSMILFTLIYALLFVLFIFLLNRKIQHGPEEADKIGSQYTKKGPILN
jgi:cytochrome d ubiquinol oxidase subunit I